MAKSSTSGTRKPWWLLGILVILFSMGSSVAVFYFMDSRAEIQPQVQAEPEPLVGPTPIFVEIKPFTVNVQSRQYDQRLLYVGLSLQVGNEMTSKILQEHMPQVRSRLLTLLSSQHAEDLTTPEGKKALSEQILSLFERPLADPQPPLAINDVLYTEFIVQ
ncbi:flagellar basal body-associated protein FliL [Litchfieldella qijiaojingensis]|uniref:Flagellar protein FliL n=1 Tax=Litchfieldella qijiaojingensis TaxID=980347 RepID=A0ABQ2YCR4_9GAMM|nr:flagellar basal body-associated protein FliL [Halomonas qijiaojingensis]GGX78082.1 flagellar basal body-associated protein FliL [Halomonas qijiaojingensis]